MPVNPGLAPADAQRLSDAAELAEDEPHWLDEPKPLQGWVALGCMLLSAAASVGAIVALVVLAKGCAS